MFAYDPDTAQVLVLFQGPNDEKRIGEVSVGELEAIEDDPKGTFHDVKKVIRARAECILKRG